MKLTYNDKLLGSNLDVEKLCFNKLLQYFPLDISEHVHNNVNRSNMYDIQITM